MQKKHMQLTQCGAIRSNTDPPLKAVSGPLQSRLQQVGWPAHNTKPLLGWPTLLETITFEIGLHVEPGLGPIPCWAPLVDHGQWDGRLIVSRKIINFTT